MQVFSFAASLLLVFIVLQQQQQQADGFYLPGVAPHVYYKGDRLAINVQNLVSPDSALEFSYYSLPYCKRDSDQHDFAENLGEALTGQQYATSPYEARVLEPEHCKVVCRREYTKKQMDEFHDFTLLGYRGNMRTDNLPLAQVLRFRRDDEEEEVVRYELGFPVGTAHSNKLDDTAEQYVLNNHLRFKIEYHQVEHQVKGAPADGVFIVGFTVESASVKHTSAGSWNDSCRPLDCALETCMGRHIERTPLPLESEAELTEVFFTYDVEWVMSEVKWASRWDVYLKMNNDEIHWFSIVNSAIVLLFLTGIIAVIMARVLRKDFALYNELSQDDDVQTIREETGWKLVYKDVFRPPPHGIWVAVIAGTGMQLTCMGSATLVFAVLGFLSPSNRGALLTTILLCFCLLGSSAGWIAARFGVYFKETNVSRVLLLTGVAYPGWVFGLFFLVDLVLWSQGSSSAVPFGTMIALVLLWFCISLPLVFLGGFLGQKMAPFDVPCRTAAIPRQIPPQPWFLKTFPTMALAGILPFGAVFVELSVILSCLFRSHFYYVFGMLFLVYVILLITVAEVTCVIIYLQLCAEDYRWWWSSVRLGGSIGVYVLLYALWYFFEHIHQHGLAGFVSTIVYSGYVLIATSTISIVCAFVALLTTFIFNRFVFSSIKAD